MFKNFNKAVMCEIGKKTMASHRLRNIMAVLAIALTTLLITTIFTVGISFYDTIDRGTDITPGPLADGAVEAPLSAYEKILDMKQVKWAAYVRPCNLGSLHNRELVGIKAVLLAPNSEFYTRNNVEMVKGNFPEKADEIAISDTMAERLGMGMEIGRSFTLRPVVLENGQQVEKQIPVTITGVYTSPIEALSTIYEEIYTAESFLTYYAPEMETAAAKIYIRLQNAGSEQQAVYDALHEISQEVGGDNVIYRMPQTTTLSEYLILLAPLALIMLCGYMLIYNVFYISIVTDIRFFGLLKTIGTSGKQLKTLLIWQTARLTAAGISIGLVLGYAIGIKAVPVVLSFTDYGDFYRPSTSPLIFLLAALFSLLTVLISCRKPYGIAMKISPVEALKYGQKSRKGKQVISAASFALSSVIFLTAFTMTLGYDVEAMVDRYNTADVRIGQQAMPYGDEEAYMPVSQEMLTELRDLPFVKNVMLYYEARQVESDVPGCMPATGQIKMIEAMQAEYHRVIQDGKGWMQPAENGDIHLGIQGFPGEELYREEPNIKILEGSLDEEKFASGGYLIYNQGTYRTGQLSPQGVRVGDQLSLSFYDLDMQQYVDKTLEVLAVVERVNPYPTGILARSALTLSDRDFKEIYPLASQMIQTVQIHGEQELTEEQYQMIEGVIQGSFNSQLSIGSRFEDREDYQSRKVSMTLLGLFLSSIFGMIGLCNIINTQVTDILTRKIEYAAMQSIGMTKRQMQQNIWRGSLALCGISIMLAIPVGILLTQKVTQVVFAFSGFSLPVFLAGCLILLGIMIGLSASISGILTGYLNRKPVVERLREAE